MVACPSQSLKDCDTGEIRIWKSRLKECFSRSGSDDLIVQLSKEVEDPHAKGDHSLEREALNTWRKDRRGRCTGSDHNLGNPETWHERRLGAQGSVLLMPPASHEASLSLKVRLLQQFCSGTEQTT